MSYDSRLPQQLVPQLRRRRQWPPRRQRCAPHGDGGHFFFGEVPSTTSNTLVAIPVTLMSYQVATLVVHRRHLAPLYGLPSWAASSAGPKRRCHRAASMRAPGRPRGESDGWPQPVILTRHDATPASRIVARLAPTMSSTPQHNDARTSRRAAIKALTGRKKGGSTTCCTVYGCANSCERGTIRRSQRGGKVCLAAFSPHEDNVTAWLSASPISSHNTTSWHPAAEGKSASPILRRGVHEHRSVSTCHRRPPLAQSQLERSPTPESATPGPRGRQRSGWW